MDSLKTKLLGMVRQKAGVGRWRRDRGIRRRKRKGLGISKISCGKNDNGECFRKQKSENLSD
jgi:hypothetical protein